MRSNKVFITTFILVLSILISPLTGFQVYSETKPVSITSYTGSVEVSCTGSNSGSMVFDITMSLDLTKEYQVSKFGLATQSLACDKVEIDGINTSFNVKEYEISLKKPTSLKSGSHKIHMKYRCDTTINNPATARLQMITTANHFHCYNAWYPVLGDGDFAPVVKFDMTVKIPGDWFLIGGWVPKEYRAKPKSDGVYKFVRKYQNPYMSKLVGGRYDVLKGGDGDTVVWVYTFKGEKGDAQLMAQQCTETAKYYEKLMDQPGYGEYIIAAQTGRRGNGQGIDGGFVMDSPAMKKENFPPEFLAHELAHSWWGGIIISAEKQPDSRVICESFAEYCALKYAKEYTSPQYYKKIMDEKLSVFWRSHSSFEPALTDENCTWLDYIVYNKGSFVLMALEGYMGTEKFLSGIREFIKNFKQTETKKERPTLADFKSYMDKANETPIDDFWKVYFESGSVPQPQADVSKVKFEGRYVEKLKCKNIESTGLPMTYRIFGLNGVKKDVVFTGKEAEFQVDDTGIAGFVNLSASSLIPKPDMIANTLGTGTIASAIAWEKPTIVCMDSEFMDRANKWAKLTGAEVVSEKPEKLAEAPLVCVGISAITNLAQDSLKGIPIKNSGKSIIIQDVTIMGNYSTLMVLPDVNNSNLPAIIDSGTGDLPLDLSWSGIFTQRDGPNTFSFRNTSSGVVSPPKPQVVELGWADKTQMVYGCRYDLHLASAGGFKLTYDGFDMDKFEFGRIEKTLDNTNTNLTIYLNLSKQSILTCEKNDRFFGQKIEQEFIYDGKAKGFETPSGMVAPKTSPNDKYELKWPDALKYIYQLDGKVNNEWTSSTSLILSGLQTGSHKLKVLFSNDGMLGKVQEFEFATGQKPPKLQLVSKTAQCKDGKIVIKGTTDPDVTLDPPATVNADGSFEMTVKADACPKTLTIKATNKIGLETVEVVTISSSKLIKIKMQLGSSTATDESGNTYTLQVPPQKIKGSTYVPMRFIGERLGAQILWEANLKKVTYILGSVTVELIIGSTEAIVNGKKTKMPGAAVVVNGKTLVPVRFVAEALGAKVSFDAATGVITIEYLVQ